MSAKKVDWDFRFIMGVMALTAVFGIWICFQAYPAQSHQVARILGGFVLCCVPIVAALLIRRTRMRRAAEQAAQRPRS